MGGGRRALEGLGLGGGLEERGRAGRRPRAARLAERRRDPGDRRAYTLFLTSTGRDLLEELRRAADEEDAELLAALDAPERSQLISLLRRVADAQGLATGAHPNLEPRG